jgi:CubicO group peptidase (beta-lactamase class C family)
MKKLIILCFFLLSISHSSFCQDNKNQLSSQVDSLVSSLVKYKNFSGTVLLSKNGEVVFEKRIPNKPDTRFCIASISKVFTASAVMKLQEQGKLSIGDKLSKYIPDFPEADKITIAELLDHTAGVKREMVDDIEGWKKHYTTREIIDSLKKYPLDFEPGTKQSYSNGGYGVVARVIEIASGKSYGQYLKEAIFDPLKMYNTLAYNSLAPQKNTAKGYDPAPFPKGVQNTIFEDASQNVGAGSIYSTAPDLLKWDRALYNGAVLKKSTLDTMYKYGYGFGVYQRDGRDLVGHDGIINGYIGSMESFINDGICIIFLSNIRTGALNLLNNGLCELYFNGKTTIPAIQSTDIFSADPKDLQKYTGTYELFPGFDLTIKETKGVLFLKGQGGYYTALNCLAANRFFYRSLFAEVKFDAGGDQPGLVWNDILSGKTYPAKKIE